MRGLNYYHNRLPPPLPDGERKSELIRLLRINPTKEVKDELIVGHLPLGITIVGLYLRRIRQARNWIDTLTGAMDEGLVQAVNDFGNRCKHDNIAGYITEVIHSKISEALERAAVVYVPGGTQRTRKKRGKERVSTPTIVDVSNSVVQKGVYREDHALQRLEVAELLERACVNDQEREVIRLRLEGMSDKEVAEEMGLTRQTIHLVRQTVQRRYNQEISK